MNAGQPLAGPYRGAFAAWKGDLKAKAKTHLLKARNAQSNFICEQCVAHKKDPYLYYTNARMDAPWRFARRTHAAFMQQNPDLLTPWAWHPGWRLERNLWDSMHNLYVGGVACDFCASIMKVMALENVWGDLAFADSLTTCRYEFKAWLKQHSIPSVSVPNFDTKFIGLGSSLNHVPLLSGSIKAAHTKVLTVFLADVAVRRLLCNYKYALVQDVGFLQWELLVANAASAAAPRPPLPPLHSRHVPLSRRQWRYGCRISVQSPSWKTPLLLRCQGSRHRVRGTHAHTRTCISGCTHMHACMHACTQAMNMPMQHMCAVWHNIVCGFLQPEFAYHRLSCNVFDRGSS
jgi:hypothetical protein